MSSTSSSLYVVQSTKQHKRFMYNLSMTQRKTLAVRFRHARATYWRLKRLYFASPAEVRFIELMGGKVWKWRRLTIVISLGKVLRAEHFKREVRYGKYYVDFANDLNRIIEVDGAAYHMDVIADMDRDIYIRNLVWSYGPKHARDARILRVKAYHVYNNTRKVQDDTLQFIQDGSLISRTSKKSDKKVVQRR